MSFVGAINNVARNTVTLASVSPTTLKVAHEYVQAGNKLTRDDWSYLRTQSTAFNPNLRDPTTGRAVWFSPPQAAPATEASIIPALPAISSKGILAAGVAVLAAIVLLRR